MNTACPLCQAPSAPFQTVDALHYRRCPDCGLVFLEPAQRPGLAAERARYDLHKNDPGDPRYRRFLAPLFEAIRARLPAGARGLDYGCGPGSGLAAMLREAGFSVNLYDPYYAPDASVLDGRYDFIACSEVAEHFHDPRSEFRKLDGLLKPGGWLGLMTGVLRENVDFANWHYRRDPTHVCFYRPETLRWIARALGWRLDSLDGNVVLFRKPGP
jgi:SAM-dependent methyltransferase